MLTRPRKIEARSLIDFPLGVGESPVWDSSSNCLWFIDIDAAQLLRLEADSLDVKRYQMPATIGSIALTEGPHIVVALRSGVHVFDPRTAELSMLANPEPAIASNRLNDGKVGPDGAFWVGSMHEHRPFQPTGALYRITPFGHTTRVLDGIAVSNGLAWSTDGRAMYHADSATGTVMVYEFDIGTGALRNGRKFITLGVAEGIPDGAAIDVDGHYWSAGVTAGCLNRIAPSGEVVERYALPTAFPTMPCFGGRGGKTIYVTSMSATRGGVTDTGSLVALDVDVMGAPVPRLHWTPRSD